MERNWKSALTEALDAETQRIRETTNDSDRAASVGFLREHVDYLALADSASAAHKLQMPLHRLDHIALVAYDVVEKAARAFFHEPESEVAKQRIATVTSAALDTLASEFEGVAEFDDFRRIYEQALIAAVAARTEAQFFTIVRLPVVAGTAGERVLDAVEHATRQSLYGYGPEYRGAFRIPALV